MTQAFGAPNATQHPLNALRRTGIVTDATNTVPGYVMCTIGDGDVTTAQLVPFISTYQPANNDVVVIVSVGADHIIVGPLSNLNTNHNVASLVNGWNDAIDPGMYNGVGTLATSPTTAQSNYGAMVFSNPDSTAITQVVTRLTSLDAPEMWMRTWSAANGWRSWYAVTFAGGVWTTLSLNSGFSANAGFGYVPAYRIMGKRIEMRGLVGINTGSYPTNATTVITALPAAIVPAQLVELPGACTYIAGLATVRIQIGGGLAVVAPQAGATWFSLDSVSYELT